MIDRRHPRTRALTLIELLIVLVLMTLFAAGAMMIFIRIIVDHARGTRDLEVRSESHLVMESLVRDLSRAEAVLAVNGEPGLVSLRLTHNESDGMQVDYVLRNASVERVIRTSADAVTVRQTLARRVESFTVERRDGGILRVRVVCAQQPAHTRFASTLETDFFMGDRLP